MGSPLGKAKKVAGGSFTESARENLNTRRKSLENIFKGEEVAGLTDTTKSEFSKRIEKLSGRTIRSEADIAEFATEVAGIETELAEAQKGEGRFGERQAIQERRNLLQDRPGRRQIFNF